MGYFFMEEIFFFALPRKFLSQSSKILCILVLQSNNLVITLMDVIYLVSVCLSFCLFVCFGVIFFSFHFPH